jgi:FkbM family methyltransferase
MRALHTAFTLLRDKGLGALMAAIYERADLKLKLAKAGKTNSVLLDGCQFDIQSLADTPMKLELLSGGYELPEREAARKYIKPNWPVIELGACVGVVACVTNKILTNPEAHVVVEANPAAIPHLELNRNNNRCSFKVINGAIAYGTEAVSLKPSLDFWGNSLHRNGNEPSVSVPAISLKELIQQEHFETFALICDIEGQEYELLMQEAEVIRGAAVIIVEVHPALIGEEKVTALLARLVELGFNNVERSKNVLVFKPLSA